MSTQSKRVLAIAGAALFVIALIAVTVAVLFFPSKSDAPETPDGPNANSSDVSPDVEEHSAGGGAVSGTPELDLPAIKFDENGIAEMQVTTDPRVAAASAARVLWSADTTKIEFGEDYVLNAIAEISQPSPDYIGAGDSVLNRPNESEETRYDTAESWARVPGVLVGKEYNPSGWWWQLADRSQFEQFGYRNAVLKSTPITVFNAEEVDEFVGGAWWSSFPKSFEIALKPGAKFESYWVRVETEITSSAQEIARSRNPVALNIYCDPPEEGGICGVQSLTTKYPEVWQLH